MIEVWGGPECTVNRVGDRFQDQTIRTGHQDRIGDLERFAELGIRRLRYPVLWERTAPDAPHVRDFAWSDARLERIRRLGMGVIAGLVHHGSGPRYTHLLDDEGFAAGLADHARAVAERYPWIDAYTPVNEPMTTARFSCLYGHWHPHATDEGAMWRALLNEIDATRLSMRAIRAVNPQAQLVATDDLGHTHATPALAERAAFDNARRWMGWDLLFGRVTAEHPLHARLAAFGLADRLAVIADDPCPPDIVGVNHYVTSERLLDDAIDAYPPELRPRPGEPPHVDVEASRVSEAGVLGIEALLAAAWERYEAPLAVTECHNGASRDEQLRWVRETWAACERLQACGVDLRAVTAWSLVGAVDWNSLLTQEADWYEPGVFDVRAQGGLRATALAPLWRALANGQTPPATIADAAPGWWRRDVRFTTGRRAAELAPSPTRRRDPPPVTGRAAPFLIVGPHGALRGALSARCEHQALPVVSAAVPTGVDDATRLLDRLRPSGVIRIQGEGEPVGSDGLVRASALAGVPLAVLVAAARDGAPLDLVLAAIDRLIDGDTLVWRRRADGSFACAPLEPAQEAPGQAENR